MHKLTINERYAVYAAPCAQQSEDVCAAKDMAFCMTGTLRDEPSKSVQTWWLMLCVCCLSLVSPAAIAVEWVEVKTISLQEKFGTGLPWNVTAYEDVRATDLDISRGADEWPVAAELCFWHSPSQRRSNCHPVRQAEKPGYDFVSFKEVAIQRLTDGGKPVYGLVVIAELPFANDVLRDVSIWSYVPANEGFEEILPSVTYTLDGQSQIVVGTSAGPGGLFVAASSLWDREGGETHFSPHHYLMRIFKYRDNRYHAIGEYKTPMKYLSLDDVDPEGVDVIRGEMKSIEKYVRARSDGEVIVSHMEGKSGFTDKERSISASKVGGGKPVASESPAESGKSTSMNAKGNGKISANRDVGPSHSPSRNQNPNS